MRLDPLRAPGSLPQRPARSGLRGPVDLGDRQPLGAAQRPALQPAVPRRLRLLAARVPPRRAPTPRSRCADALARAAAGATPGERAATAVATATLEIAGLTAGYGGAPVLRDLSLTVSARRGGGADGRQRRGQDDDAARDLRPGQARRRARSRSRDRTWRRCRRPRACAPAWSMCPRTAASSTGSPWASTSASTATASDRHEAAFEHFPALRDLRHRARRPALRRRAADAGDRARARAPRPSCCCSTSSAWGSRRSSSSACCPWCAPPPTPNRPRCCWWSSTCTWPWRSPIAATCSPTASSSLHDSAERLRSDSSLLAASYLGEHRA